MDDLEINDKKRTKTTVRITDNVLKELKNLKLEYEKETGNYISINQLVILSCAMLVAFNQRIEFIKQYYK